jgi:hypothetical protein
MSKIRLESKEDIVMHLTLQISELERDRDKLQQAHHGCSLARVEATISFARSFRDMIVN